MRFGQLRDLVDRRFQETSKFLSRDIPSRFEQHDRILLLSRGIILIGNFEHFKTMVKLPLHL
jgi:hypothetical protein